jgi:protein-serine/threonine kinase
MIAQSALDRDDDWLAPAPPMFYRAASVGNSWGVTCIGRGFDWNSNDDHPQGPSSPDTTKQPSVPDLPKRTSIKPPATPRRSPPISVVTTPPLKSQTLVLEPDILPSSQLMDSPICGSPLRIQPYSQFGSLQPPVPFPSNATEVDHSLPARSPTLSRPRRRSSQQRVSLIAGRVSIAPIDPPSPTEAMPQILRRSGSTGNPLTSVLSTRPPTPTSDGQILPDGKTISDFFIEREIGRGAYGLVKRAQEYRSDGTLGVRS